MGLMSVDSVDLGAYQLKGMAQIWFKQWKENRAMDAGLVDWIEFKGAFLDRFFPLELREEKIQEFRNLRQGKLPMQEYSLKFTQLSEYDPALVVDSRARTSKFISGISWLVVKECKLPC